ncbi:F-box protein CPR1-like [Cicer arietinum]|uniref:F-box protein CPR1-like n=1 Tax=Cicer arietinum TaxID=3827 RepID=A0A1S2Z3F9_CICAR|nr:F-box protein CPR1-like [Cicer arietinum]
MAIKFDDELLGLMLSLPESCGVLNGEMRMKTHGSSSQSEVLVTGNRERSQKKELKGNDGVSKVIGVGDVCLQTNMVVQLLLKGVKHASNVRFNLIYVHMLDESCFNNYFPSRKWKLNKDNLVVARGEIISKLFENRVKLDWPPPFHEDNSCIHILSSVCVNGTLCLTQGRVHAKCVFWNPATDEFKVIPPSLFDYVPYHDTMVTYHGFGYDHVRDDYKVIRRLDFFLDCYADVPWDEHVGFPPMWEIYSLRSNSWRKLDVDIPFCLLDHEVYMDGFCHWSGKDDYHSLSKVGPCLVSFDLCNEVFLTTPFPSDMVDHYNILRMVLLNGSIAFIIYDESTTFHIRIVGELGVKESWTNVFIVKPLPCVQHLIGVGEKGGIFLRKNDDELVWYDISTQTIEELGVKVSRGYCNTVVYKDNLLSIVGL